MELERSATDAECEGSSPSWGTKGIVAQSVEQGPEKPCVTGSIPVDPTICPISSVEQEHGTSNPGVLGSNPRWGAT